MHTPKKQRTRGLMERIFEGPRVSVDLDPRLPLKPQRPWLAKEEAQSFFSVVDQRPCIADAIRLEQFLELACHGLWLPVPGGPTSGGDEEITKFEQKMMGIYAKEGINTPLHHNWLTRNPDWMGSQTLPVLRISKPAKGTRQTALSPLSEAV
jgi:hypothetical protein